MINLKISAVAFLKMQTLVAGYDHEVGWYGTAEKVDDTTYRIMDILVYPQYASAAYIDDKDTTEMPLWFQSLSDEDYNFKRFHGHSHVNMGVTPSGTDNTTYEQFKKQNSQAQVNRFSIELIMNKKFEMFWKIHDAESDKEYTSADISVEIEITEKETMASYFEKSKEYVKELKECRDFIIQGTPKKIEAKPKTYGAAYGCYSYDDYEPFYNTPAKNAPTKKKEKKHKPRKQKDNAYEKVADKFIVCNMNDGIKVNKGYFFTHTKDVLFDVYNNAFKIVDNRTILGSKSNTVFDALLDLERDKFTDCNCFMIFDADKLDILSPTEYEHPEQLFQQTYFDKGIITEKDTNIFVIYVQNEGAN